MGRKIKTFAKILIWFGIIGCCVSLWFGFHQYYKNRTFLEYATINGGYTIDPLARPYLPSDFNADWEQRGNESLYGLVQTIGSGLGIVACIISGLPLYWFGCLFQRVEYIQADMIELHEQMQGGKPDA